MSHGAHAVAAELHAKSKINEIVLNLRDRALSVMRVVSHRVRCVPCAGQWGVECDLYRLLEGLDDT